MVWNSFLTFSWGRHCFCLKHQSYSLQYLCSENQDLGAQCAQTLPTSPLRSSSWGSWTVGFLRRRGSTSSCCVWAALAVVSAARCSLQLARPAAIRVSLVSWSALSWLQLLAVYSFWSMKVRVLGCRSWMRRGSSSFRCSSCWSWGGIRVLHLNSCLQPGPRAVDCRRSWLSIGVPQRSRSCCHPLHCYRWSPRPIQNWMSCLSTEDWIWPWCFHSQIWISSFDHLCWSSRYPLPRIYHCHYLGTVNFSLGCHPDPAIWL